MEFKLEICCDSFASAMAAKNAGTDRIELCSGLSEGGVTPSSGLLKTVRNIAAIKLHVLIRPRGGDFLYSKEEIRIMQEDIRLCKDLEADGIVLGFLKPDGTVDKEATSRLVEAAHPMSVTFHRAFDMCADPYQALEDIISCGADRILTSGQKNKVTDGMELIAGLVQAATGRIIIMPGSGISVSNIDHIARNTGANEFHLSAGKARESQMIFKRSGINMGTMAGLSEYAIRVADEEIIREVKSILEKI